MELVDDLERERGLKREQRYILPSMAVSGQVVGVPSCTVSATIDPEAFEEGSG